MNEYVPDNWLILSIDIDGEKIQKVLCSWSGGYLSGDSWKLSSMIENVIEHDDRFEVHNASGSSYVLYKNAERMSGIMSDIYDRMMRAAKDSDSTSFNIEYWVKD